MRRLQLVAFFLILLIALVGCQTAPGMLLPLEVLPVSGNTVYRFQLQPGQSGPLTLPSSNRLALIFLGNAPSTPFQFRIQGDALPQGEAAYTESGRRMERSAKLPLSTSVSRSTQAVKEVEVFWVNKGNSDPSGDGDVERTARLRVTSKNAYFYLDPDPAKPILDSQIQKLADAFDNTIYPQLTKEFGQEPKPGIDGEDRLFVVISPAVDNFGSEKGLLGYFWSRDALPNQIHSNRKEVIFLSPRIFNYPNYTCFGTLAHEFTHLIVFNQKTLRNGVPEDTWLNEGFAMLGMDLCGYGLKGGNADVARDIGVFLDAPQSFSLTEWASNPRGFSYGLSYLFCRYFYDRYPEGPRDAMRAGAAGVSGIERVLSTKGLEFSSFFADWAVATYLSGSGVSVDPRFTYASGVDLRGRYGSVQLNGVHTQSQTGLTGNLRPWSASFYLFDGPREWQFDLRADRLLGGAAVRLN